MTLAFSTGHWYFRNMSDAYSLGVVQFPRLVARYKQIGEVINDTNDRSSRSPLKLDDSTAITDLWNSSTVDDPRSFDNGAVIAKYPQSAFNISSDGGYNEQPQIEINADGSWTAVITTGADPELTCDFPDCAESAAWQHVVCKSHG